MSYVNKSVQKKDAKALVTGQPVYTDDLASKDCLIVKVLRSPHPHAIIEEIKTEAAKKVPGIACILTCLLYTSPSPRDLSTSRMPSSA